MNKSYNEKINLIKVFANELWRGKGVGRILGNLAFSEFSLGGEILDFGSSKNASYHRFFKVMDGARFINVDISEKSGADFILNMESDLVPLDNNSVDQVLMLGLLEHMNNHENILKEAYRVLKPGGNLLISVPFLVNVHRDPHDYVRLTDEKIISTLTNKSFDSIKIKTIGYGPFVAAYSLIEFMLCWFCRLLIIPLAFLGDYVVCSLRPDLKLPERYPLAYVVTARKSIN